MFDRDTVKISTWIGASNKNQIIVWYHGDREEFKQALDYVGATNPGLGNLQIPITPDQKFLVLDDPDLVLIGGHIIDLN